MNRRELIMAAGGVALATTAGKVFAGEVKQHEHKGGHGHMGLKHLDLIKASAKCLRAGEIANRFSLTAAENGDISMIKSVKLVQETIAACEALIRLATYDSKSLSAFASATAAVCDAAEKECSKHKAHKPHEMCAKACRECSDACKKYA